MTQECRKMSLLVSRSLDRDLDREETGVLDAHLVVCAKCRMTLERFAAQKTLLDAAFSESPLPAGITVLSGGRGAPVPRAPLRIAWRWGLGGAIAAAFVAIVITVVPRQPTVAVPGVVFESSHPSTMVLPLSSIIYYEEYAGSVVHSQFIKLSSHQQATAPSTAQELLEMSSYDSPLFIDSYEIDPVAIQAEE